MVPPRPTLHDLDHLVSPESLCIPAQVHCMVLRIHAGDIANAHQEACTGYPDLALIEICCAALATLWNIFNGAPQLFCCPTSAQCLD